MVGAGTGAGSAGLGFEYAGDLGALRERLEEAGHEAAVIEEAFDPHPARGQPRCGRYRRPPAALDIRGTGCRVSVTTT